MGNWDDLTLRSAVMGPYLQLLEHPKSTTETLWGNVPEISGRSKKNGVEVFKAFWKGIPFTKPPPSSGELDRTGRLAQSSKACRHVMCGFQRKVHRMRYHKT